MHSLFARIFLLFWLAMAVIAAGSIAVTNAIATRELESLEWQKRPAVSVAASEALARGGPAALRAWLAANRHRLIGHDLYIIGPDGRDLLGRTLSPPARHRLEFGRQAEELGFTHRRFGGAAPLDLRPMRLAPQIVTADGRVYTILIAPRRPGLFGALTLPGIPPAVLAIALIVSALASGWLARQLSAPIRRMQAGARALAEDRLELRVSAGLDGRKDELAVLARDFDAMAEQLRATRAARRQLLRDISHELRSPLARMRVAIALARQSPADPARQIDRMEREIERLDGLIGQVLKLARLHPHAPVLEREAVDLDELLAEVVRDASFEAAAKRVSVRLQGAARRELAANRELLRSAIENVLRNAVRYSPDGADVDLRIESEADAVRIHVLDRGPGVPAAELQRIFEPFYRVAESRDRDSGGEGIGLAITAQVLRAHGGAAQASNRPGGGLDVLLELPLGSETDASGKI
ncbi:MAG: HAMP domain-containing protein [Gammaproteobacteria bacterium]|nr:HAMP domain-containing protein [Gammaproteobacteria bacterium]